MNTNHITLKEAIEVVSRLDPDDRLKLRHALDQMTGMPQDEDAELSFKRVLLKKGLISEIRSAGAPVGRNRRAVSVQGKPVSETLIGDRG